MAYKGNLKQPVRISMLRRSKRQRKFRTTSLFGKYMHRRSTKNETHICCLPDDVLLQIFSYFNTSELFYKLRPVCRRWKILTMNPTLWKEINVPPDIPTDTLVYWIKSASLLKSFTMKNRNDTNIITEEVNRLYELSKNCKHLESIQVQNCWGSTKNSLIQSTPLCNLVTRCSKLYNFNFSQSRFLSKKFFRLISRDPKNGKIMKKCSYVGPMTTKQMKALFAALRDYEIHDTATIGNVNFSRKFKLRDMIRHLEERPNPRQIVNEIWDNLYYGEEAVEMPINQLEPRD